MQRGFGRLCAHCRDARLLRHRLRNSDRRHHFGADGGEAAAVHLFDPLVQSAQTAELVLRHRQRRGVAAYGGGMAKDFELRFECLLRSGDLL